ncbi:hypothetical protein [uncultured Clostridium sp.]|uniref:hypothetical protein n=1 Tax=uncultured Clostridium sp. TaxID=59620 RepID=UPI0026254AF8|nr:hypothetical protein [uncultured Clostridium sp.]
MSCIKCNDALIKGLNKCPKCGKELEKTIVKATDSIDENRDGKELKKDMEEKNKTYEIEEKIKEEIERLSSEKKIKENIELENEEEMCEYYNEYIKKMKLYCLIGGLIIIAFFIFVLYIIF